MKRLLSYINQNTPSRIHKIYTFKNSNDKTTVVVVMNRLMSYILIKVQHIEYIYIHGYIGDTHKKHILSNI